MANTVISKTITDHRLYVALFILTAGLVLSLFGRLPWVTFLGLCCFAVILFGYQFLRHRRLLHNGLWLLAFFVGVVIATYRPPAFDYPLIFSVQSLHEGGAPFTQYLNVAKALAGLLVMAFLLGVNGDRQAALATSAGAALLLVFIAVVLVIIAAQQLLELPWTPKFPAVFWQFMLVNVFVTCFSEEAFFRLLLHRHMMNWFSHRWLRLLVPVLVCSVLFAFVHHPALDAAFAVYWLAGAAYGLVYALTNRFVMAVGVHAGVNLVHFLLLPYPLVA